jgi:hypothetical protein
MAPTSFVVEKTYLLPEDELLASGRLVTGEIEPGTVLHREDTGQQVHVLDLEFPTPTQVGTNKLTLRIDPQDRTALQDGVVLIST